MVSLPSTADWRCSAKNAVKIGVVFSAVMVFAAIAVSQDVRTDYDKRASFETYHTYYREKAQTSNPLWESRIRDASRSRLAGEGLQKVESGGDGALIAVGSAKNEREYQPFCDGLGG
jgi:hypothetical protein